MPTLTKVATPAIPIWLDERGVAWIDDTNTKVREVVLEMLAHGASPTEIHFQYPHLSLAKIHAALSFYYEHQDIIDTEIRQSYAAAESLRTAARSSPLQTRLAARVANSPL